jgi:hypothetical protein
MHIEALQLYFQTCKDTFFLNSFKYIQIIKEGAKRNTYLMLFKIVQVIKDGGRKDFIQIFVF